MSENKLDIIVKAINLMEYTMTITSNRKRFPVKHLMLVRRIQECCMDIYEYLIDANRIKLDTSKSERQELQTKAISCCDKLSCYVELSMKLNLVGTDTVSYWQKQVNDVKYMAIAWRSKDKQR
ncbi:four helix bundle protein [Konateibacter massiliensis]|uniref:four helix bundle protein n=1 Tax=Konateibacter massiliensis TaxID=2002841 RepID=UPI000C152DFD|nr:four helix bundle protein [Konateibacter massiliensis]